MSSAQRKSHKSSGDCDMFIRTECWKLHFVNHQAKMEAEQSFSPLSSDHSYSEHVMKKISVLHQVCLLKLHHWGE